MFWRGEIILSIVNFIILNIQTNRKGDIEIELKLGRLIMCYDNSESVIEGNNLQWKSLIFPSFLSNDILVIS